MSEKTETFEDPHLVNKKVENIDKMMNMSPEYLRHLMVLRTQETILHIVLDLCEAAQNGETRYRFSIADFDDKTLEALRIYLTTHKMKYYFVDDNIEVSWGYDTMEKESCVSSECADIQPPFPNPYEMYENQ